MNNRIFGLVVVSIAVCACSGCTETADPALPQSTDSGQSTQAPSSVPVARANPAMPAVQPVAQSPIAPAAGEMARANPAMPSIQPAAQSPIAPPQGDNRKPHERMPELLFTGAHPLTRVTNGGFEWFYDGAKFPLDWTGLLNDPICAPEETIVRHAKRSVKLTGESEESVTLKSKTAPSVEELRGKTVRFGAWLYTSDPERTTVGIIFDWSKHRTAKSKLKNTWQLVTVVTTIPEDAEFLHFGITLQPSDEPVVCYVDGAALYLE